MVQLVCPLCGKFSSLRYFDPSSFEHDVLGVDTVGLGRGRGTRVVDKFSMLDDSELMGTIRDRCSLLVEIINGKGSPDKIDVASLQEEVDGWRRKSLDLDKERNDLEMKIADMETNLLHWQRESTRQEKLNRDYRSKIANMESSLSYWQGESLRWQGASTKQKKLNSKYESRLAEYERIARSWKNHGEKMSEEVSKLRSHNLKMERRLVNAQGEVKLAEEYVNELLWTINSSADEDFEDLAEAVDYLLEMG